MQVSSRRGAVRSFVQSLMLVGALVVAGCGGGGGGNSNDPKPIASLAVTPATADAPLGSTVQLTATVTYTDQSTETVTAQAAWTSADAAKVSVGAATGLATAVAIGGPVTVTATFRGTSASSAITVGAKALSSIDITPAQPRVGPGATQQLSAIGSFSDGTKQDYTNDVTWASSTAAAASVSDAAGTKGLVSVPEAATQGATSTISATLAATDTAPARTANTTLTVGPVGFAYVANFNEDSVAQFVIGGNGALTPLATAEVSAENSPIAVAADPQGRYLYVVNNGDVNSTAAGTVSQYAIGLDGGLTPIAAAIATGTRPTAIAVHPNGRYVYVSNRNEGSVSQYAVGSNGALSALSPAFVLTGPGPQGLAIATNASGAYLYVSNGYDDNQPPSPLPANTNTVSQFSIGSDGKLTAMSTPRMATGDNPFGVAADPLGKYLYVTNFGDDSVSQYSIGASDGALSPLGVLGLGVNDEPVSVKVDPSGGFALVVSNFGNNVKRFSVGANGTLTLLGSTGVGSQPEGVAFDPSGRFAYVANSNKGGTASDTVSQFRLGGDGALTALSPATVASGTTRAPWAIATVRPR